MWLILGAAEGPLTAEGPVPWHVWHHGYVNPTVYVAEEQLP